MSERKVHNKKRALKNELFSYNQLLANIDSAPFLCHGIIYESSIRQISGSHKQSISIIDVRLYNDQDWD